MTKDVFIGATSFFQGGSQFGHPVEGPVLVYGLGKLDHPRHQPRGVNGQTPEAVAEDFPHQIRLGQKFVGLGAEQDAGSAGLGTSSGVSGGDCWVGSSGVPCGPTSRSLTSEASGTHLLRAGKPVGKILRYIDRSTTEGIYPIPHAPRTSDGKQPELPVARPAGRLEEFQHCVRLASILPF